MYRSRCFPFQDAQWKVKDYRDTTASKICYGRGSAPCFLVGILVGVVLFTVDHDCRLSS